MRALRICTVLSLATLLGGCLDQGGGPEDQWMNTDAYVGPEVSTILSDGGVTCGDAPVFAAPERVSDDAEADGGALHAQYAVTMAPGTDGTRYVAWTDRDLGVPGTADLRAAAVPAGADGVVPLDVPRPAGCDLLLDPVVTTTAAGTVVLTVTCVTGPEAAPSQTNILVFRSTDGLETLGDPVSAATCIGDTLQCDTPTVAATAGAVYLGWAEWALDLGAVTSSRIRVWRSDDDGDTLAEEVAVTDSFTLAGGPRFAVGPDDALHLVYTGALTLDGNGYAAHASLASATSFNTSEILGPGSDPWAVATADGVYVAWAAGTDFLYESHSTGGLFSPPLPVGQISGATEVMLPALAAGPDGWVHLLWQAYGEAGWSVYYSVTKDAGATWLGPLTISGPFDGDPSGYSVPAHQIGAVDLVADTAGVTLGWAESRAVDSLTGASNVYFAERVCP
jgi:hypothetical protein